MEKKWFIYCAKNEFRLNEVDLETALDVLRKPKQPSLDTWFAWCAGMKDWQKVSDLADFQQLKNKVPPPPASIKPPPLPKKVISPETVIPFHQKSEKKAWSEKRKQPRYQIKMKVIVSCNGKTFRTFTKDVSLGGLYLESSLPEEMVGNPCEVYIASSDGKRNIKFESEAVGVGSPISRISFQTFECTEELNQWISNELKRLKKAA